MSLFCHFINDRTARIPGSHHSGNLVIRLADRVVLRCAENLKRPLVFHPNQLGMTAGHHQRNHREPQFVDKAVGVNMSDDVMQRDQRFIVIPGQGFRGLHADMQRADKAGALRYRDR